MTEPIIIPFKERARSLIIQAAKAYSTLLGTDFIVSSNKFVYRKEYILRFEKKNFLHLTGVKTRLSAEHFYQKTIREKLTIYDFDCDSTSDLSNKVRRKLNALIDIGDFFECNLLFQEMFERNTVKCLIASTNKKYTLGFSGDEILWPKTLLNSNRLDPNKTISKYEILKNTRVTGGGSSQKLKKVI